MNIYLIVIDGVSFCIKAKTMGKAVEICEKNYLIECKEENSNCNIEQEKEYYHEQILQSCSLVGELKN